MWHVLHTAWDLTKQSVVVFIDEGALNRGAAIAFYAITSIGPILLIVVAVVGVVYGEQAALLTVGKMLIGLYIGRTGIASSYGAARSVIAVMLWIYCSAEIFLLGAEFTSLYARHRAAVRRSRDGSAPPSGPGLAGLRPPLPPEH